MSFGPSLSHMSSDCLQFCVWRLSRKQIFKEQTGSLLGTERELYCMSFKVFTFPVPFKHHLNSGTTGT